MPDNGIWPVLFAFLVLIAVLALAYVTTKWLGKRAGGGRGKGNIEILDRQFVGQDKSLMIVRVGKQTMLLGVTSSRISKLSDVDETGLNIGPETPDADFASIIRKALNRSNGGNDSKGGLDS